jgi:transposase
MARPQSEMGLIDVLGADFLGRIHKLRAELVQVIKADGSTIEEVSLRCGISIETIMEFVRGHEVYRTSMLSKSRARKNLPPKDNISVKTYDLLRKYTDKRLKIQKESD